MDRVTEIIYWNWNLTTFIVTVTKYIECNSTCPFFLTRPCFESIFPFIFRYFKEVLVYSFFNYLHTFSKLASVFFSKLCTNPRIAHTKCKMPHISCKMKHCFHNITSQKQTFALSCKHLCHNIIFLDISYSHSYSKPKALLSWAPMTKYWLWINLKLCALSVIDFSCWILHHVLLCKLIICH